MDEANSAELRAELEAAKQASAKSEAERVAQGEQLAAEQEASAKLRQELDASISKVCWLLFVVGLLC